MKFEVIFLLNRAHPAAKLRFAAGRAFRTSLTLTVLARSRAHSLRSARNCVARYSMPLRISSGLMHFKTKLR